MSTSNPPGSTGRVTPYLGEDFRPDRYRDLIEPQEFGWGCLYVDTTIDLDTNLPTRKMCRLDLHPESGIILDTLEQTAGYLMTVDEVVSRIEHADEMANQLKKRKQHLVQRLAEIVGDQELVEGERFEAGLSQKPELGWGRRKKRYKPQKAAPPAGGPSV